MREGRQVMNLTKTKTILKPVGLNELREHAKSKLRVVQLQKMRQVSLKDLLQVIDVEYTECEICYRPLVQPVTLYCGHTFCLECFEECTLASGKCSFCMEIITIKEIIINQAIKRFVRRSLSLLGSHHRKTYYERKRQIKDREKVMKVNISDLKAGDCIDYRDVSRMRWFQGSVMKIEKGKTHHLIHVEFAREHGSLRRSDVYQSHSLNIAAAGFFSNQVIFRELKAQRVSSTIGHSARIKLSPNMHHLHPLLTTS